MLVEIHFIEGTVILRAKGAELFILPDYVTHLQTLKVPQEFIDYFRNKALVNRPARKLFEAWAKKDPTLWNRVYATVHKKVG